MAASQNANLFDNNSETIPLFNEKANISNTVEGTNKLVYVNHIVFSDACAG